MKEFVCDSCKRVIQDAFDVKMKEFYYSCDFKFRPLQISRKRKIRLCGKCFSGLKHIADMKGGAE